MLSYVYTTMQVAELLTYVAILIVSVIAHELSHGYVAKLFGDRTAEHEGRLTLNPVSHIDPVGSIAIPAFSYLLSGFIFGWAKPVPYNPYNLHPRRLGEIMVAAAGPLTNLGIAIVFGILLRVTDGFNSPAFISVTAAIIFINIILAIFNSVPIPPLDGSKVLFSLLPFRFYELERTLETFGLFILVFFLIFLWPSFSPVITWLFHIIAGVPLG